MSKQRDVLAGSHRSVVAGSDKGTGFFVEFSSHGSKPKPIPKRLQEYSQSRKTSSEDLIEKQKKAEERKKKHDENKILQARKVREEAMRYDQNLRARLPPNQRLEERKWYAGSLPQSK